MVKTVRWTLLVQLYIFYYTHSQNIAKGNLINVSESYILEDTLISAVTIDKYTVPDVPSSEVLVKTHLVCFIDENVLDTVVDKQDCCTSLLRLSKRIFQKGLKVMDPYNSTSFHISDEDTDIQTRSQWCLDKLANIQRNISRTNDSMFVPIYYLSIPNINSKIDWDETGQLMQYQYVQKGQCLYHDKAAFTPFHLKRNLQSLDDAENQHNSCAFQMYDLDERYIATAKITSSLSQKGGMHRVFHQKLVLSSPPYQLPTGEDNGKKHQIHIDGNATIFMPISEHIFIDADDPLVLVNDDDTCELRQRNGNLHSSSSCMVTLVQSLNQVVDIEQPSFASPQHVIVFNLHFEAFFDEENKSDKKLFELEMEFNPIIHFRYPAPLDNENKDNGGYFTVQVATPILYSGSYNLIIKNHNIGCFLIDFLSSKKPSSVITTRIASGLYTHYSLVILSTIFASICGTLVLIRYLSKVSSWC